MATTRKRSTVAPACLTKTSRRRLTLQGGKEASVRSVKTPQQQVLENDKFLEAILERVDDMRTILLSQRVNKTFKRVIKGSTSLQQQLWLEPNPDVQMWHAGRLNPLLSRSVSRKRHKHILALTHSGCDVCILTTMGVKNLEMTGSWQQMLVHQPHSPFTVFTTADCWASGDSYTQNNFQHPPTAGQLVDKATLKSQDTSVLRSMRVPSLKYDRKCGHLANEHAFGRAKVAVQ